MNICAAVPHQLLLVAQVGVSALCTLSITLVEGVITYHWSLCSSASRLRATRPSMQQLSGCLHLNHFCHAVPIRLKLFRYSAAPYCNDIEAIVSVTAALCGCSRQAVHGFTAATTTKAPRSLVAKDSNPLSIAAAAVAASQA
jgi:hypothetical protein